MIFGRCFFLLRSLFMLFLENPGVYDTNQTGNVKILKDPYLTPVLLSLFPLHDLESGSQYFMDQALFQNSFIKYF